MEPVDEEPDAAAAGSAEDAPAPVDDAAGDPAEEDRWRSGADLAAQWQAKRSRGTRRPPDGDGPRI